MGGSTPPDLKLHSSYSLASKGSVTYGDAPIAFKEAHVELTILAAPFGHALLPSPTPILNMRHLIPFRDINVHASAAHYAFTSPSSSGAQTLVVERPSGDLRLSDGPLLGTKRVSSIAGILGMIKLRLGKTDAPSYVNIVADCFSR